MFDPLSENKTPPRIEWFRELLKQGVLDNELSEDEVQAEERRLLRYIGLVTKIAEDKLQEERYAAVEPDRDGEPKPT